MKVVILFLVVISSLNLVQAGSWNVVDAMLQDKKIDKIDEAITFLKNDKSPKAYHLLGVIYGFQDFGIDNRKQAIEYILKAVNNGWHEAYVDLGTLYYLEGNIQKAAQTYKKAAEEHNDVIAKESLYLLYNNDYLEYDKYAESLLNELVSLKRPDFLIIQADRYITESIEKSSIMFASQALEILDNCEPFKNFETKGVCHHLIGKLYLVELSPMYNLEKGVEQLAISSAFGNEMSMDMYKYYKEQN